MSIDIDRKLRSAGKAFTREALDLINDWYIRRNYSKNTLIDKCYDLGRDKSKAGTSTRVNCILAIIEAGELETLKRMLLE